LWRLREFLRNFSGESRKGTRSFIWHTTKFLFPVSYRPPRTGRNPKSGENVAVPEKFVPHFKAGRELRERVDAEKSRGEGA
jgi:hypothetical protein